MGELCIREAKLREALFGSEKVYHIHLIVQNPCGEKFGDKLIAWRLNMEEEHYTNILKSYNGKFYISIDNRTIESTPPYTTYFFNKEDAERAFERLSSIELMNKLKRKSS